MENTAKCLFCGKEVSVDAYRAKRLKYCSMKCYGMSQRSSEVHECSVDGCTKPKRTKGFCNSHYLRFLRHGDPTLGRKTPRENLRCYICGEKFSPKTGTSKYCSRACYGLAKKGDYIIKNGYKKILMPGHKRADSKGYVFEHILVAEKNLGRQIKRTESIHHINGDKLNNSPNNICVFGSHSKHMEHHKIRTSSRSGEHQ